MSIDSEILASNPLAFWKLDEGTGTVANNSATKNTPADYHIPNAAPSGEFPTNGSWQTDSPTGAGSCWQFSTNSSAAFVLPDDPVDVANQIVGTTKHTIEYWIKATSGTDWNPSSPYGGFFPFSIYDGGNEPGGDGVSVYSSILLVQGQNAGYWEFGDNGGYQGQYFIAPGIGDGAWHHMVHRFDASDTTGRTKIFMDGVLIYVNNARTTALNLTDQEARIGARVGDPLARGGNAKISRLALYDAYALTDGGVSVVGNIAGGEVYNHFNGAGSPANTAPTVGAVAIETATVYANTTPIQAKVASVTDAEQGTATLTWRLKKGVTTIRTITEAGVAMPVTDRTVNFSSFGTIAKGDSLTVELTVDDLQGSNNTTVATSAAKVVANSAPTITAGPTISPLAPGTNDTLTASYTAADVDTADTLTPTYLWEKQVGGAGPWSAVGGNTSTLDLSTAGNGDVGDKIRVTVTVSDGTASSAPVTSAELTVLEAVAPSDSYDLSGAGAMPFGSFSRW